MKKKVVFLHPDLGIGGAERLVVDAALALISIDYDVQFVTTHHDETHCFTETKNGTFPVTVVGDWIPRNILGRCFALCAYLRMIYAAIYLVWFSNICPDVIFCDIVSACIPILKLRTNKVIFYCHYPDQLLSLPGSRLKCLYRAPLNWIEEKTTSLADVILVNSKFTRTVFQNTFTSINITPAILHPSINTELFNQECTISFESVLGKELPNNTFLFLSINRYERKKNISLAIKALTYLKRMLTVDEWNRVELIIAGGYDVRVSENIEYLKELKDIAANNNSICKVTFLKSPSDSIKNLLLKNCDCLLYTPPNEHFGIVPLEAMYSGKPVIALNSGGPTETIVDSQTGYLCEPSVEEFSFAMAKIIKNVDEARIMGFAGKKRFEDKFSFDAFRESLNAVVVQLCEKEKSE